MTKKPNQQGPKKSTTKALFKIKPEKGETRRPKAFNFNRTVKFRKVSTEPPVEFKQIIKQFSGEEHTAMHLRAINLKFMKTKK